MRRYVLHHEVGKKGRIRHYDVIIAGAGLAGLYAALLLDSRLSVAVLVKDRLQRCNSSLAQGGIAAVTHPADHTEQHLADTLKAAKGLANEEHVRMMVEEGPAEIRRLTGLGIQFDTDNTGNYYTTQEGGHTMKRVLHCGGDATGEHMIQTLADRVTQKPNVDILEHCFLLDVLTNKQGEACGVHVFHRHPETLYAPNVILATGGIGQVYQNTTNQPGITGDGIAAALRAGAACRHMEFVQFHPTAFYSASEGKTTFLISEAVRGESGILRNHRGEAFMEKYHTMKELAPRDIVARAIINEMQREEKPNVFLDITSKSSEFLSRRFPTIWKNCLQQHVNMAEEPIPVAPSQHYIMGGIDTDSHGKTSVANLFACGETACTGVHGANRLASNSLLECLVFSRRCAGYINNTESQTAQRPHEAEEVELPGERRWPALQMNTADTRQRIKKLVQAHGGIVRDAKGLSYALENIRAILNHMEAATLMTVDQVETYNIALVAEEILSSALERKESVGAHYRRDDTNP